MSDLHTPAADSRSDQLEPTTLAERDDVEYAERTVTHETTDHCEADADGRVVVGVSGPDGDLLVLEDGETGLAALPNGTVDAKEDWHAVAREVAAEFANQPVTLDEPVRVRRVEHVLEDDPEPHSVTHQVVFPASVEGADDPPEPSVDDHEPWIAGWRHDLPDAVEGESSNPVADIEIFLS